MYTTHNPTVHNQTEFLGTPYHSTMDRSNVPKTATRSGILNRKAMKGKLSQPVMDESMRLQKPTKLQIPRSADRVTQERRVGKGKNSGKIEDGFKSVTNEMNSHNGSEYSFVSSPRSTQYEEGKVFFREARKALPFDKFNIFIKHIQLLNKNLKTKEETMLAAENLFGEDNRKLLEMFRQLLYHGKNTYAGFKE